MGSTGKNTTEVGAPTKGNPVEYKGYGVDYDIYGQNEYSVQVAGDDFIFKTFAEAKRFIDEEDLRARNEALGLDFEKEGRRLIKEFERNRELYNKTPFEQVDKRNELRRWITRNQNAYHIYKRALQ